MIDAWRELLYPLGFLSSAAFGARALLQWLKSESKKESVTPPAFWYLSLVGNLLLLFHSLVQAQFHVYIVQACNAVISWRNINLMQPREMQLTTKKTVFLLLSMIVSATLLYIPVSGGFWFGLPALTDQTPLFWHFLGFTGLVLFASRFWVQWWCAEKQHSGNLGALFWWTSLFGDVLTLVYFFQIKDPVNLIGPLFGLIPYVRNLMLIYRKKATAGAS